MCSPMLRHCATPLLRHDIVSHPPHSVSLISQDSVRSMQCVMSSSMPIPHDAVRSGCSGCSTEVRPWEVNPERESTGESELLRRYAPPHPPRKTATDIESRSVHLRPYPRALSSYIITVSYLGPMTISRACARPKTVFPFIIGHTR